MNYVAVINPHKFASHRNNVEGEERQELQASLVAGNLSGIGELQVLISATFRALSLMQVTSE